MLLLLVLLVILFSTSCIYAQNNKDSVIEPKGPTYMKVQYAGNIGLLSVGMGQTYMDDKLYVDLNYGYLPKRLNGVRVHSFAIKASYQFVQGQLSSLELGSYAGMCVLYGITSNTYIRYPDLYPDDYYLPNALHLMPLVGCNARCLSVDKRVSRVALYSELGTVDYKIWYALKNKKIKPADIFNFSFGVRYKM
ncbi:MAG TPA: hypothetical protein PK252_12065 [Bacteroidales bacterium]|nr:hypothetical protein [Bacteroidales bacterium]